MFVYLKPLFQVIIFFIVVPFSLSYSKNNLVPHQSPRKISGKMIESLPAPEPGAIDPFDMLSPHQNSPQHFSNDLTTEGGPMAAPKPGWIDPFDMLGESQFRDSLFVQSDVEIHSLQKRCKSCETFLRRFVNLFLLALKLKDIPIDDANTHSIDLVKLQFSIEGRDRIKLKKFGEGLSDAPKIQIVSDIFSRIFTQVKHQDENVSSFHKLVEWLEKSFFKIISSPEWTVLSSVVLLLFLSIWLIFYSQSYRLAMTIVFLTIFFAGFGFTWIRMYEEKEVEKFVSIETQGQVPKHCSKEAQTMAWYEHMYYRMFGVDCVQFYKVRDVRLIVKISPTDVFSETLSSMIIKPANNIGKAYGGFVTSLLSESPWWSKPFVFIFGFLIPLVLFIPLLAFLCDYRLSLSITGLHFIPTLAHTSHSGVEKNTQYVEECPRKEFNSSDSNTYIRLLSNDSEVFVTNWKGLKKLSSSSLLGEEKICKEMTEEVSNENTFEDDCDKITEIQEFQKFLETMETQKLIEECRRRNISDLGESSSDVKSDPQMLENTVKPSKLSCDDINATSSKNEKEKCS